MYTLCTFINFCIQYLQFRFIKPLRGFRNFTNSGGTFCQQVTTNIQGPGGLRPPSELWSLTDRPTTTFTHPPFFALYPLLPPSNRYIPYTRSFTDSQTRSTLHSTLSKSLAQYIPVDMLPLHSESARLLYHCGSQTEAIEALSAAVLYKQRNPSTARNSEFHCSISI